MATSGKHDDPHDGHQKQPLRDIPDWVVHVFLGTLCALLIGTLIVGGLATRG